MRCVLVGRMRNFSGGPPEEYSWDFGGDEQAAWDTCSQWVKWMREGLWQFREWGSPGPVTLIKPGAFIEMAVRFFPDVP